MFGITDREARINFIGNTTAKILNLVTDFRSEGKSEIDLANTIAKELNEFAHNEVILNTTALSYNIDFSKEIGSM